ncbi:hypothetical protein BH11PSE11_BH11PSE11_04210 [soil metagenome]
MFGSRAIGKECGSAITSGTRSGDKAVPAGTSTAAAGNVSASRKGEKKYARRGEKKDVTKDMKKIAVIVTSGENKELRRRDFMLLLK